VKQPNLLLKKFQETFVLGNYQKDLLSFSQDFLAFLKQTLPYSRGAIKLILNPQKDLMKVDSFGLSLDHDIRSLKVGEKRINERVLANGHYEEVPDLYTNPLTQSFKDIYRREGIRALLAIPIKSPWETVGVLNLYKEKKGTFPRSLIKTLENLLRYFGAIANLIFVYQEEKQRSEILQQRCDELKTLVNFYELIIENIPVGVVATDKKGEVVLMNQMLEEMSGQNKERVLGKKWYKVFGFYGETRKKLENTFWTGKVNYFPEIHLGNVDGKVVPLEMKTTMIKDEHEDIVGVVAICSDLKEKKKIEKEVERIEKLSVLGQVATGIAHEIRNPLAGISGILQILKGRFKDDKQSYGLLKKTFGEIDRLNNILESLLSFTSPQKVSFEKVSIEEICKGVLLFAERPLANNKIILLKRFGKGLPRIFVDRASIKQVILNVLINAIKAMPEGGKLKFETFLVKNLRRLSKNIFWHQSYPQRVVEGLDCSYVAVSIGDEGIGIPAPEIPKIFEPFYSSTPAGMGLGLYISSKIMEKHKGLIGAVSSYRKGSTFYILFPTVKG
jgi:PAS domain S-box-containing protein